jgi:DNA-binding transcriptional LysR family regulator
VDLILARTFLEVVAVGNFSNAAERLYCTQSTVSARIKALEDELGRELFVRNKAGAVLTPAGRQFQRHAAQLLRTWEHARQDVAVPQGYAALLRVGSEAGLWMRLLYRWIPWMQEHEPQVALRIEDGSPDVLMHHLVEGTHDLAVMYTPQSRPGLKVTQIAVEDLVLVMTPDRAAEAANGDMPAPGYVYVDWGREFNLAHRTYYPEFEIPGLMIGIGMLAYRHVMDCGGSGFFPRSLVQPHLDDGSLVAVDEGPTFPLPIYAVHPAGGDIAVIERALAGLRNFVAG